MALLLVGAIIFGIVGGVGGALILKENPFKAGAVCAIGWFVIGFLVKAS